MTRCCCAIKGRYLRPSLISISVFLLSFGLFSSAAADCCAKTGLFPADPTILHEQVDGFLNLIPAQRVQSRVFGLLLPGENYLVAGSVMGAGYQALLDRSFDEIVIITQDKSLPNGIWIPQISRFITPLGTVVLSRQFANKILKNSRQVHSTMNCPPPSFWYQLPFLQSVFGPHRVLPIVVGDADIQSLEAAVDEIVPLCSNRKIILIAVSNLSSGNDMLSMSRMDRRSIESLKNLDYISLLNDIDSGVAQLSSPYAVIFTMMLVEKLGAVNGKLLRHIATSGLPVKKHTGMCAVVWYGETARGEENTEFDIDDLTAADGNLLWEVAQATIMGKPSPKIPAKLKKISSGVFITLSRSDSIIARVGDLFTTLNLPDAVRQFSAILLSPDPTNRTTRQELDGCELSVCIAKPVEGILTPAPDMGIYIKLGEKVGLLFPGEGAELSPKRRMENACLQAGISSKSWCVPETNVHFFTLKVFSGVLRK